MSPYNANTVATHWRFVDFDDSFPAVVDFDAGVELVR